MGVHSRSSQLARHLSHDQPPSVTSADQGFLSSTDPVETIARLVADGAAVACVLRAPLAGGRSTALRRLQGLLASAGRDVLALRCADSADLLADLAAAVGSDIEAPDVPGTRDAAGVLRGLAGRRVVLLVDDVQWADAQAAAVLGDLARCPAPTVAALALTAPAGAELPSALDAVPSVLLPVPEPAALLATLGPRADLAGPRIAADLAALCAHLPVVLSEAAAELTDDQLAGRSPLPRRPPLGPESLRLLGRPLRGLPTATRRVLLLLALAGTEAGLGLAAARAEGFTPAELAPAETRGAVRVEGGAISWCSPLLPDAIIAAATLDALVSAAHTVATACQAAGRRSQLARCIAITAEVDGKPDGMFAAVTDLAADGALLEGYELAIRAMALTTDAEQTRFRTAAAELAWLSGFTDHALELATGAPQEGEAQLIRWVVQGTRSAWPVEEARTGGLEHADPSMAVRLLGTAFVAGWESMAPDRLSALVQRMSALPEGTPESRPGVMAAATKVVRGCSLLTAEEHDGLFALSWWQRPDDVVHPKLWPPPLLPVFIGAEARYEERYGELLNSRYVRAATSSRSLLLLKRACVRWATGDWSAALADAESGAAVAARTGQPAVRTRLLRASAWIHASRGHTEPAAAALAEAATHADGVPWHVLWIKALLALGAGQAEAALDLLRELHAGPPGSPHHLVLRRLSTADLATAAVWARRAELIDDVAAEFAEWSAGSGADWARLDSARCRAMLAGDDAGDWHERAVELAAHTGRPWSSARTRLEYGTWLRRKKLLREARGQLRTAAELFADLGATSWRTLAAAELRAAGEKSVWPESEVELTAQERRIAELAARGLSNRDIGTTLRLSHRTVGYHLHKTYAKLHVTSRVQLAAALTPPEP
jgi:DNA-binding CsgD family transcriptional regulator